MESPSVHVKKQVLETMTSMGIFQRFKTLLFKLLLLCLIACVSGCGAAGLPLPLPDPRKEHIPHPNDESTPEPLVVEETYDASFAEVWEASLKHLKENFTILTEDKQEGLIVTDRYTQAVWERKFRECAGQPSGIEPPLIFLTVEIENEEDWVLVRRISSTLETKLRVRDPEVISNQDSRYVRCLEQSMSPEIWRRSKILQLIDQRRMNLGTR